MRTVVAAVAAGAASIAVHGAMEFLAARFDLLPRYLEPLGPESLRRYGATFALQALGLVLAYCVIGNRLPGAGPLGRGLAFGALIFLLGACLPLVPMALVYRHPFSSRLALEGLVGGAVVSIPMGIAFVWVWERVAR